MTIILFLYSDLKQFFIGDEFESNEFLVYVLCPTCFFVSARLFKLQPFDGSPRTFYFSFGYHNLFHPHCAAIASNYW